MRGEYEGRSEMARTLLIGVASFAVTATLIAGIGLQGISLLG